MSLCNGKSMMHQTHEYAEDLIVAVDKSLLYIALAGLWDVVTANGGQTAQGLGLARADNQRRDKSPRGTTPTCMVIHNGPSKMDLFTTV